MKEDVEQVHLKYKFSMNSIVKLDGLYHWRANSISETQV